jgi:ABC-type polysaccharide/polyol phosphate transport system ATPase subunit
MSAPVVLRMDHVYKKFTKGERHDSLRDLIPALTKRAIKSLASPPELRAKEFWALQDVSFDIHQGEAVGIIGHNGAGKSTMLKHLSGLLKPTRGSIEVVGRLSALIDVGAGFHPDLTGRENIFINGSILGMSREEIRRKFDDIVAFSELEEFIDTPVKRYSSGMFARLGFAVAVHMDPDILIIDEVLSVGDFAFQAKGVDKMRSILKSGATVIFVSHSLRSVADLCDRALLFAKGRLLEDGPVSNVIHTYMKRQPLSGDGANDSDVLIESVTIYGIDGPRNDFTSGDKAQVEIRVRAIRDSPRVACAMTLDDDHHYQAFHTSSERLGHQSPDLRAGDTYVFRFELTLHLARGNFHLGVGLYRYDIGKSYDPITSAGTLLINTVTDVGGIVNLEPRVIQMEHTRTTQVSGEWVHQN